MANEKEKESFCYFDSPDGEDVDKKFATVIKPAALVAFGAGTFDVLAWSHPKTYLSALGRYAYVAFPILGASSTFVLATNAIGSLRKKDDRYNWFLGGFVSGSVIGAWRRSTILGFNCGMFFGLLGLLRKMAAERGWKTIVPPADAPVASNGLWDYDFSLMKHRPGNWTTKAE